MPDLLEKKVGHGSVAMGNKFYVIGVFEPLSCEVFDKVSRKFARIKQLPPPLSWNWLKVFRVQNEIVVKFDTIEKREHVFVYDTITDKWTSMCVDIFKSKNSIIYKF